VFNVVPSLLRQLEAAAAGVPDDHLLLARAAPADLDAADRARIVRDFFAFHHARRFAEFPRLRALWELRGEGVEVPAGRAERFTDRDLLDLQVLFHLAWCGRTLREEPAGGAAGRPREPTTPPPTRTALLALPARVPAARAAGLPGGGRPGQSWRSPARR
jgi:alpha-amylase/alpha-mannosidase (GH57 family)